MKIECEKCKQKVEELWLTVSTRKDGSAKEVWICKSCAGKTIKDFTELEKKTTEFEEKLK